MPPDSLSHLPAWLTARRLRAQALSLALGLWGIYVWVLATPGLRDRNGLIKGTDFLHFYTLGMLARAHLGADLYDMPEQTRLLGERIPVAAHTVYLPLYGPQVSLLFTPFAALPYGTALIFWLLCSTVLYAVCVYVIWKTCPHVDRYGSTVLCLAVAYPAFFNLIAWGQTSALALVCFTGGYALLRTNRHFAAGLAFGCLMFKPQLGIAVAFVFCVTRTWGVIGGALITSIGQLLVGWLYYGSATMHAYASQLLHIGRVMPLLEPRIEQTHCLRTFWQMLIPWPPIALALYVVCAMATLWLTLRCWRSSLPLGLRYSAILLATVLVSPHLTVYDLIILAPALLLIADHILSFREDTSNVKFVVALYLVYTLPLLGFLARWMHVQLSVLAISILLWLIFRSADVARVTQPA
jgi:Glycosyltransferase family 87